MSTTTAVLSTSSASEISGSHHSASPKNRRTGIPTGALNGTYDRIVMMSGLSLKNTTPKYGSITSIIAGVMTAPVSSCRDTSDAPAAKMLATSTKPNRKNTTNQII